MLKPQPILPIEIKFLKVNVSGLGVKNMKFKKIAASIIAFGLLVTGVYASEPVSVQKDGANIKIQTKGDIGEKLIMAAVKKGHSLSDTDYVCVMRTTLADEEGNAVFEFIMPETLAGESASGEYTVYIRQTGQDMNTASFRYTTSQTSQELTDALTNVIDADGLKRILDDEENIYNLDGMDFNTLLYNELSEKDKASVIEATSEKIVGSASVSIDEIRDIFNRQTVLYAVNSAKDENDTGKALEKSDFEFEGTGHNGITDGKLKSFINKAVNNNKQYADNDELDRQYKVSNILYQINSARFSALQGLLEKYADELGITENGIYKKYLNNASGSLNERISSKLKQKQPENTKQLLSIIEDELPSESSSSGGSSGGSGGGKTNGSSSGGFSGGASGAISAFEMKPAEDNTPKITFDDMDSAIWASDAVNAMVEKGIINGDGNGHFRPNDTVTREEFVKMLVLASGLYNKNAKCNFSDVPSDAWYYSYVASAVSGGIVKGISDNEFGSGRTLTREDMAVMAYRIAPGILPNRADITFDDEDGISDYAKDAIHKLYRANYINGMGDGSFAPKGTATRAQAAQIIYNLFVKGA